MESTDTEAVEVWKLKRPKAPERKARIGRFELFFVHVQTGRYLTVDGKSSPAGAIDTELFDSRDEALNRKDQVLDQLPWVCVRLVDRRTEKRESFISPKLGEYTREKRRYLAWKSKGVFSRLLSKSPPLNVYDPKAKELQKPA